MSLQTRRCKRGRGNIASLSSVKCLLIKPLHHHLRQPVLCRVIYVVALCSPRHSQPSWIPLLQLGLIGQEQEQLSVVIIAFEFLKRISLHLEVLVSCRRSLEQLEQVLINCELKLANALFQPHRELRLALGVKKSFVEVAVGKHSLVLVEVSATPLVQLCQV
jgi:hypothetical protein